MKKILSITLFLLPLVTAAGQLRIERHYNQIVDDPKSCFYDERGPKSPYFLTDYNFGGATRIISDKDTLVCYAYIDFGYSGYKNSVGTVHLHIEDQHEYPYRHNWFADKDIRKLKRHMRIKVKSYRPFTEGDHPFSKILTAYIDFRPFDGGSHMNLIRFTLKRGKFNNTEKYGYTSEKIRAKQQKRRMKEEKWLKKKKKKNEKWLEKYYRKYNYITF
jgi:hypothetical protein